MERGKKSSETQKINWENKSEEEKDIWSNKCREAQLGMSEDAKALKAQRISNTINAKPQEEKDTTNKSRSESCKKFWQSLSEVDRESKIDAKLERTRTTCLELYGVPYPCMREEARMRGQERGRDGN